MEDSFLNSRPASRSRDSPRSITSTPRKSNRNLLEEEESHHRRLLAQMSSGGVKVKRTPTHPVVLPPLGKMEQASPAQRIPTNRLVNNSEPMHQSPKQELFLSNNETEDLETSRPKSSPSTLDSIETIDSDIVGSGVYSSRASVGQTIQQIQANDAMMANAIKIFNAADKDKNGTIDQFELFDLLKKVFSSITLPESNRIYHEMDTNRSGTITFDEFLAGLKKYCWDSAFMVDSPQNSIKEPVEEKKAVAYEWEIPFNELKIESKLGEGTFGVVYKAKWRGCDVAVKELKSNGVMSQEVLEDFKQEISLLGKLRHPNIVLYMGACTKEPNMCMITEFLEGGSMYDVVHVKKKKLDLKTILSVAKQTAFGLNYLHLSDIIHRDLKSLNLLVDRHFTVKVCDFGLSCIKPKGKQITEQVGSPLWMCPELLMGKSYDEKADVYSFAICLVEALTGKVPFAEYSFQQLIEHVGKNGRRASIPDSCPSELANLIRSCWDPDSKRRPNFGQIIAHLDRIQSIRNIN